MTLIWQKTHSCNRYSVCNYVIKFCPKKKPNSASVANRNTKKLHQTSTISWVLTGQQMYTVIWPSVLPGSRQMLHHTFICTKPTEWCRYNVLWKSTCILLNALATSNRLSCCPAITLFAVFSFDVLFTTLHCVNPGIMITTMMNDGSHVLSHRLLIFRLNLNWTERGINHAYDADRVHSSGSMIIQQCHSVLMHKAA